MRGVNFSFRVHGLPAPQGSKRHVGHGVMIESSKHVKPWREAVKWAAIEALNTNPGWRFDAPLFTGPVELTCRFFFARPKSHLTSKGALRSNAPTQHAQAPDLSKLIRSTEDAITDAGIWLDDKLVCEYGFGTGKYWATSNGATIIIKETARAA